MNTCKLNRGFTFAALTAAASGCAGVDGSISMREFEQEDVSGASSPMRGLRGASLARAEGAGPELKSEVVCADDAADCGCDVADVYISKVFVKSSSDLANRIDGTLWHEGERTDGAVLEFKKKTKIGVDLYYDDSDPSFPHNLSGSEEARTIDGRRYHSVTMQDQRIFDVEHPFDPDVGLGVFEDGTSSYTFAIGASASRPNLSPLGCYLRIVVDFDPFT